MPLTEEQLEATQKIEGGSVFDEISSGLKIDFVEAEDKEKSIFDEISTSLLPSGDIADTALSPLTLEDRDRLRTEDIEKEQRELPPYATVPTFEITPEEVGVQQIAFDDEAAESYVDGLPDFIK